MDKVTAELFMLTVYFELARRHSKEWREICKETLKEFKEKGWMDQQENIYSVTDAKRDRITH
jgi:hypothetical protein